MKNAKSALEMAHYMGELPTFVEELNMQADAPNMRVYHIIQILLIEI